MPIVCEYRPELMSMDCVDRLIDAATGEKPECRENLYDVDRHLVAQDQKYSAIE